MRMLQHPAKCTLFPYTTLFRSSPQTGRQAGRRQELLEFLPAALGLVGGAAARLDRKSTRLNSSHGYRSYAVFCLKKKIILRGLRCITCTSDCRPILIPSDYPTN